MTSEIRTHPKCELFSETPLSVRRNFSIGSSTEKRTFFGVASSSITLRGKTYKAAEFIPDLLAEPLRRKRRTSSPAMHRKRSE